MVSHLFFICFLFYSRVILCEPYFSVDRVSDFNRRSLHAHFKNSTENMMNLNAALKSVIGVYVDKTRITEATRNVVFVTASNHAFLNHLHNFKCFIDRLGMKALVLAMDKRTHDHLTSKTNLTSYFWIGEFDVVESAQEFRSKHFNLIVKRKKYAVYEILKLGYDVLFR